MRDSLLGLGGVLLFVVFVISFVFPHDALRRWPLWEAHGEWIFHHPWSR